MHSVFVFLRACKLCCGLFACPWEVDRFPQVGFPGTAATRLCSKAVRSLLKVLKDTVLSLRTASLPVVVFNSTLSPVAWVTSYTFQRRLPRLQGLRAPLPSLWIYFGSFQVPDLGSSHCCLKASARASTSRADALAQHTGSCGL